MGNTLKRRWHRAWARPSTWVLVLVVLAGLCLAGLRFLPWFDVHTVEVQGNQHVSTARIVAAASVQHESMLELPVTTIEQRVEGLAEVATARVVRQWPNEVRIVVQERMPVAYLRLGKRSDGRRFGLVGSDGVVFRATAHPPRALPELAAVTAFLGDQLAGTDDSGDSGDTGDTAAASLHVARALSNKGRAAVDTIDASDPSNIVLLTRIGVRVIWGGTSATDVKASDLALLLHRLLHRRGWAATITTLDVSAPSAPAYH